MGRTKRTARENDSAKTETVKKGTSAQEKTDNTKVMEEKVGNMFSNANQVTNLIMLSHMFVD